MISFDTNVNFEWRVIKDKFFDSCEYLKKGELIKSENFGLFDAMSAIEIMDSKMDAGMVQETSFSDSNNQSHIDASIRDMNLIEKIVVFDKNLSNLVTWLEGSSLVQTIFTSTYIQNTNLLDEDTRNVLRSFLKVVEICRNQIIMFGAYEDEDIQTNIFNFSFEKDLSPQQALSLIKTTDDQLSKFYRSVKNKEDDGNDKDVKAEIVNGLVQRIKFQKSFLNLLILISGKSAAENLKQTEIIKCAETCIDLLSSIMKPAFLLESEKKEQTIEKRFFDPNLNQKLLPPTFPKNLIICSIEETLNHLKKFCEDVKYIYELAIDETNVFDNLFSTGLKFSSNSSLLLSRVVYQSRIFQNNESDKPKKVQLYLQETVQKFSFPSALKNKLQLLKKDYVKEQVDAFIARCSPAFVALIKVLGHNKSRQREKLGILISDFSQLQSEAQNVDFAFQDILEKNKQSSFQVISFNAWITHYLLLIMKTYVLLGFELKIYSPYELYYVYWYLGEILITCQVKNYNRLSSFLVQIDKSIKTTNSQKRKTKVKDSFHKEIASLTAERSLNIGYFQGLKGLMSEGLILQTSKRFDNEEMRYNHRFQLFQNVTIPPYCNYSEFSSRLSDADSKALFSLAKESFEYCRNILENSLEKLDSQLGIPLNATKKNIVIMRLLLSGFKMTKNVQLNFEEDMFYPSIEMQKP